MLERSLILNSSGIKADSEKANCISIVYEFNNNSTSSLLTGDNVGNLFQQQIQNSRSTADADNPKLYHVVKVSDPYL